MKIEITVASRSAGIAAGALRELLAKGDALGEAESRATETVAHALIEADRIVIEPDDSHPQEY